MPNPVGRAEWTRQWLRNNAEQVLRSVTEERLFLDQFARDALAMLQKREQIPELVRRLNSSSAKFTLAMKDPWTLDRIRDDWTQDLVAAAVIQGRAQGIKLKPGRTRRIVVEWMAQSPSVVEALYRMPQQRSIPRDVCTQRFMQFLVERIQVGGKLMLSLAATVAVGEKLPDKARNCQIHLMRFLRSHAALVNREGDGPWREAALVDTWTGHGFTVDGIQDVPEAVPIAPAGPRRFELNTSDIQEAKDHPAVPLSTVLRELTVGLRRKESAVHPWQREPPNIPPPPGVPRFIELESGVFVPAETYQDIRRPDVVAWYDLPAVASLVVTQIEGLLHQLAHADGHPIGVVPRVRESLAALGAHARLSPTLLDGLSRFFREGLSSPRFRFAHGTLGDKFLRETFAIARDGVSLWNDVLDEGGGRLSSARTDWWWSQRALGDGAAGFVRRFTMVHGATEQMIDHMFDVPKLLKDISPNHIPYWQLASSCHSYPGCTYTTHWALAHICVPMVEAILRNVAEIFGFKILKVGRVESGCRFDLALLNERELLSEPLLATFWPDAIRLRDGRRTLALFLRIRNALAHGEILALDLRGVDVVRFSLLVASIFLWPLRLSDGQ